MSGVGKRSPPASSGIWLRLPPTALLLISLVSLILAACGGGAPPAPPAKATIALSPATLNFSGTAGGADPGVQAVTLTNTGTATLSFTATPSSTPSGWLDVFPTSGSLGAGGSTSLTVSVNIATLEPGSYTGSISVSGLAASNSPQSVSVSLTANTAAHTVTSISPSSAAAGGAAFALNVIGTGFIFRTATGGGSVVQWNGGNRTTTFVSSTQLTAEIPETDIATPGTAQVRVFNPDPGGGFSNAVRFGITELIPGVGVIERVSVASDSAEGDGLSEIASISADGRFVAFDSEASNLVPADTNAVGDVFVHDRQSGQTTRLSVTSDGTEADGGSTNASISADGRFVAFESSATNLVPTDTNQVGDVFVRDTCGGGPGGCVPSTIRVSVASDGTEGDGLNANASISADGRFVAFDSEASNLVSGDTQGCRLGPISGGNCPDIFVRDTCVGAPDGCVPSTIRVSMASDGSQGNERSTFPVISADGRFVAFQSDASNLVGADGNSARDIFVRDTCAGGPGGCVPSTIRVSVASDSTEGNFSSATASISADGRFVAFRSDASNLVPGDTANCLPFGQNCADVFVRDTCVGAPDCVPSTIRVSVASDGTQGNFFSVNPSISADGRFVAFISGARNLVPGDTNGHGDVFLRDTCQGAAAGCTPSTVRVSVASDGTQADGSSFGPSISADGRFVAFGSDSSNLVAGDSNGFTDIFVATTGQVSAPVIITTSLPDGTLGTAYSVTLNAVGGMPPLTWSIDEGGAALPPGVTLDPSSGVLSGVPMFTGTFNFTARVTDSASPAQSDTQALILTIR